MYFANDLEGDTYGLEFSSNYQVSEAWSLHAGYTLLKEHLRVKPGQYDLNDALNETADPQAPILIALLAESAGDASNSTPRCAGSTRCTPIMGRRPEPCPATSSWTRASAWHATDRLESALAGQNLLHDRHPEYGFPDPARPEIERSAYGKFTWRY